MPWCPSGSATASSPRTEATAQVVKKLLLVIAILVLVGAGIAFYLWRQATALPDWYTQADGETDGLELEESDTQGEVRWVSVPPDDGALEEPLPPPSGPAAADAPSSKPTGVRSAHKRGRSDKHVLRGFHRRGNGKSKGAVRASRAVLDGNELEAGVVLDLSKVPRDKLVERDERLYERAVANFPGITKRDVYVGIEDEPVTQDGVLQLGPDPKVRIGNLRYSLDEAAKRLGMSPADLRAEFNRELKRLGFTDPGQ